LISNRAATASSCRTCPKVKDRNVPSVEGARAPVNDQPAHRAPQQRHILEAVHAGDHPRAQDTDQLRERADAQTEDLRVRLQELRERADERAQELRARIAELTAAATVA